LRADETGIGMVVDGEVGVGVGVFVEIGVVVGVGVGVLVGVGDVVGVGVGVVVGVGVGVGDVVGVGVGVVVGVGVGVGVGDTGAAITKFAVDPDWALALETTKAPVDSVFVELPNAMPFHVAASVNDCPGWSVSVAVPLGVDTE
jgi:hypothetical protein